MSGGMPMWLYRMGVKTGMNNRGNDRRYGVRTQESSYVPEDRKIVSPGYAEGREAEVVAEGGVEKLVVSD